jgi:cell wall-associated NlpC family hydrolase
MRECVLARARQYTTIPTQYRLGSTGPTDFDCTGLVYRVFTDCSANDLIGAQGEQLVFDYYTWFAARGLADAIPPQEGDLIVYGLDFAHVAIYVGNGRAISALLDGVREHDAVRLGSGTSGEIMPVKAYLHIQAR